MFILIIVITLLATTCNISRAQTDGRGNLLFIDPLLKGSFCMI